MTKGAIVEPPIYLRQPCIELARAECSYLDAGTLLRKANYCLSNERVRAYMRWAHLHIGHRLYGIHLPWLGVHVKMWRFPQRAHQWERGLQIG